jgi:hypothetical protein
VREMEVQAIRHIASACHLQTTWTKATAGGSGTLVVEPLQAASVASPPMSEVAG